MATAMPSESIRDETPQPAGVAEWLAFGLILLAYAPLLYVYFQQLWDRPHYQFFPLVLFACGYLLAGRRRERENPRPASVALSRLMLLAGAGLLALAIARLSPFTAYLGFVIATGAVVFRMGVPAVGPWLLLFLMLRIPYGQDVAAIQAMQRVTTELSGTLLDTIGIEHFVEGNVLVFPSRTLFVEEACSGVVSMLAMVACAGILAAWWRRSLLHGLLLMATGVFWAGAMNVIRVVGIAIALAHFGVDLTEGWRHAALGLFAFAVSLAALVSTERLLLFALARIRRNPLAPYWVLAEENVLIPVWNFCAGSDVDAERDGLYGDDADDWAAHPDERSPTNRTNSAAAVRPAPRLWEWVLVPVFLMLGAAQMVAGIGPFSAAPPVRQAALDLQAEDLPDELNGWEQVGFESQSRDSSSAFGEHSRIWMYRKGRHSVQLSLDFVFPEWHALTACYRGAGWELQSESLVDRGTTEIEARFAKPNGEHAYLIFDLFDAQGADYTAPDGSFVHPQLRRILSGEATRFTLPTYYQVQLLAGLPAETLDAADQNSFQLLFQEFEARMRSRFAE